jgi:heme-degrading monooxygenase HmoA
MYLIVWRYQVAPNEVATFEQTYGPHGTWAKLFARANGFVATELWKLRCAPHTYIVLDRWSNEQDYWLFRQKFHAPYSELDSQCQGLTEYETLIGQVDVID